MKQQIRQLQANCHKAKGEDLACHQQNHIHWGHPHRDKPRVHSSSLQLLQRLIEKIGINSITITSTVRTAEEQAAVMLHNIQQPPINPKTQHTNWVNYGPEGSLVNVIGLLHTATNLLSVGPHTENATIQRDMATVVRQVGPSKVSKHAPNKNYDTIDFVLGSKTTLTQRQALIESIRGLCAANKVSGFGWPEGPKSRKGKEFRDGACFHIEIPLGHYLAS